MFINSDQAMIEAQAKTITKLQNDLKSARDEYKREIARLAAEQENIRSQINKNQQAGKFYLQLQQAILDNPVLLSEWERFCSFLKLSDFNDYDCKKPDSEQKLEASEISFMGLEHKNVYTGNFQPRF